jgi:hypothetical protein
VLAEEMVDAGAQVVILDPLDAWWGLRSSADGADDGIPIYVFGGEHGDLPLEATAGELLADVVVDQGISAILSLRHLSKAKQRQFVTAFAERLYHRKGEPQHRTPLHVFLDEADAFVPQRVMADTAKMVGAIDDIVRRGRSAGLGVTLISQRAAVVNKDVLTQCEVLVALRTISPQDRKALDLWVEAHDAHDQRGPFMESLASLDVGEAWIWSPGWLDIFERVRIRRRRTFDSSATPKAGARAAQPKQRAEVDLDQLRERMEATIERAKADDPKELKKRIRELERDLQQRPAERVVETVTERVEVPVLNGQVDDLREVVLQLVDVGRSISGVGDRIIQAIDRVQRTPSGVADTPRRTREIPRAAGTATAPGTRPAAPVAVVERPEGARALGRAERSFLSVLAQFPDGRTRIQAALQAGYSPRVSTTRGALGALRAQGLIAGSGSDADPLRITDAGVAAIGDDVERLPERGDELIGWWLAQLGKAEAAFLAVLTGAYPNSVPRAEAAAQAGYDPSVSTTRGALGRLRTLGLITGSTDLRASEDLF